MGNKRGEGKPFDLHICSSLHGKPRLAFPLEFGLLELLLLLRQCGLLRHFVFVRVLRQVSLPKD